MGAAVRLSAPPDPRWLDAQIARLARPDLRAALRHLAAIVLEDTDPGALPTLPADDLMLRGYLLQIRLISLGARGLADRAIAELRAELAAGPSDPAPWDWPPWRYGDWMAGALLIAAQTAARRGEPPWVLLDEADALAHLDAVWLRTQMALLAARSDEDERARRWFGRATRGACASARTRDAALVALAREQRAIGWLAEAEHTLRLCNARVHRDAALHEIADAWAARGDARRAKKLRRTLRAAPRDPPPAAARRDLAAQARQIEAADNEMDRFVLLLDWIEVTASQGA